jgi:hypothetical protein
VQLDWKSYFIALAMVGLLALLLRWAYGGRSRSLVERRSRAGHEDDYGLMVSIASPSTFVEGEMVRQRLVAAGVKAQLVTTADSPRLMVFRDDEPQARRLLAS